MTNPVAPIRHRFISAGDAQALLDRHVDRKRLPLNLPPQGAPLRYGPACHALMSLTSWEYAKKVENPLGKGFSVAGALVMETCDRLVDIPIVSAMTVDRLAFRDGMDHYTGVNQIQEETTQSLARWAERAIGYGLLGFGATLYYHARKNRGRFSKQVWQVAGQSFGKGVLNVIKYGALVFLASTHLISDAATLVNKLNPSHDWNPTVRLWTERGITGSMLGGGIYLLAKIYSKTAAHLPGVAGKNFSMPTSLLITAVFTMWNTYCRIAGAQKQLLSSPLYNKSENASLNPFQWSWRHVQINDVAAFFAIVGITALWWSKMFAWTAPVTDKILKLALRKRAFGVKNLLVERTAMEAVQGAPSILEKVVQLWKVIPAGKILAHGIISGFMGLPIQVGVFRMYNYAQDYTGGAANKVTSGRGIVTNPMAMVVKNVNLAWHGYSTAWGGWWPSMFGINAPSEFCAYQYEGLYQMAKKLVADYHRPFNADQKREIATDLVGLALITFDNGNPDPVKNMHAKVRNFIKANTDLPMEEIEAAYLALAANAYARKKV